MKFRCSKILLLVTLLFLMGLACRPSFLAQDMPTATPTKTPKPPPTNTPDPAQITTTPTATSTPVREATPTEVSTEEPTDTPVPEEPTPTETPTPEPTATPVSEAPPAEPTATPEPTDPPAPEFDFVITELRVLGLGENNGGIEGASSGRTIFITVLDAAGNPLDGAHIVNTAEYPGEAISGDKGSGKAEILMDREVFRLKIDTLSGAPVSSETSRNMSLMQPVPEDIVGKLGGPDYPNAACVTLDNCPLPPGKHFSYVITFQKIN